MQATEILSSEHRVIERVIAALDEPLSISEVAGMVLIALGAFALSR